MLEGVEAIQEHFPAAEMERAMKIQEVILKAMAGKLKWWEAAEIIGVTDRTMRRWREKYAEHGYSGLWDHRKRSPSPKRVPVEDLQQVLQLYRERYFDFNVQHFHEKLCGEHGLKYSYTWVKTALQEAGMVERAMSVMGGALSHTSRGIQFERFVRRRVGAPSSPGTPGSPASIRA
jgi:transposase